MKKKLIFFPSYLAPLKYFERLIPFLEDKYEVSFFVMGGGKLKEYCDNKGLDCHYVYKKPLSYKGFHKFPIIGPVLYRLSILKEVRSFFNENKFDLIASIPPRYFHMNVVVDQAIKSGADSVALQWSLWSKEDTPKERRLLQLKNFREYPKLISEFFSIFYEKIVNFVSKFKKEISPENYLNNRFVVINEHCKSILIEEGIPKEKISVIPIFDLYLAKLEKDKVKDEKYKNKLLEKYSLEKDKQKILIIENPFHLPGTIKFTDEKGQIEYFKNICKQVREVFSDAEIIFKIHPREKDIYSDQFSDLNIKVIKDAELEELVALSDLCISHPFTSANFTIVGSETNAIFINLSPLKFMNEIGKYYGVKNIVKKEGELKSLLENAKNDKLELQYEIPYVSDSIELLKKVL